MHRHFRLNTFKIFGAELPHNIKLLLVMLFVFDLSWGIIDPLIPLYIKAMVPNYTLVGVIFAVLNLTVFLAAIPIGDLADRVRPRRLIKIALVFYAFLGIFYSFAAKFWQLIIVRSIHGIANPLLWVSTESFIRQNTPKETNLKAFGWYSTIVNFAVVVGAIIGSFLVLFFNINSLFLLLVPLSLISLLVFYKVIPSEKTAEEGIKQAIEEIVEKDMVFKREMKDFFLLGKKALLLGMIMFFISIISYVLYFVVPLISSDLGIDLSGLMLLYAFLHVPFMFCFLLAGLANREGKMRMIQIGLLLMAIVLAIIFFSTESIILFVILCFVLAFLLALIIPALNSLVTDISPNLEIGEMTGIYYGIYVLGGTIGPICFGIIGDFYGLKTAFLASAIIAVIIFVFALAFGKKITK